MSAVPPTDTNQIFDLNALMRLSERPPLFAPHGAPFWDDPHIARQMLAAHLAPQRDAASRSHSVIDREVDWISQHLGLVAGDALLDLGCGPGLYCERFAQRGLRVTGVDLSPSSIAHARERSAFVHPPIDYVVADYRRLDFTAVFDLTIMIFWDFAVLADSDRDVVLAHIHRALWPGGAFVFDVTTPSYERPADGTMTWAIQEEGFWRSTPYLELTRYYRYPKAPATLRQVLIVEPDGRAAVYRIWDRAYTPTTIETVLDANGFRLETVRGDLTGAPHQPDSPTLGLVARRV